MKQTAPITVAIPVGPGEHNQRWLNEALMSLGEQTVHPAEVLIIEDGSETDIPERGPIRKWRSPWRVGVPGAFNFGVALASNDLVIMMGSDDKLLPACIETCWKTWNHARNPLGYYYLGVQYSDGREQNVACHAAMVTKQLWNHSGGFPPESAVGACDTMLLSILIASEGRAGHLYKVSDDLLYWYRVHEETDTSTRGRWQGIIWDTRNLLTELHKR